MGRSGMKQVIYLIEECNLRRDHLINTDALKTAITSTQAVSRFFVHKVPSIESLSKYVVRMSKNIKELYKVRASF